MQAESQKIDHLKTKSAEKTFFSAVFFDHLKKNRPKKSVILKMVETSAQMGGYNPPKRVIIPPYNPPEKRFELLSSS